MPKRDLFQPYNYASEVLDWWRIIIDPGHLSAKYRDLGREGLTMLGFLLGVTWEGRGVTMLGGYHVQISVRCDSPCTDAKSMEKHYLNLCAVVTSRAILSLGVACFKWSNSGFSKTGPVPLEARVFNVWLLTQQPFVTDPSSAQFLILHGQTILRTTILPSLGQD